MNVQDVLDLIEKVAPSALADEWDNVGLMCGKRKSKVTKVLLAVDITTDVLNEAISLGCDLILAHHPFLFSKLSVIDDKDVKSRQIIELLENKISVISAHTNADSADGGMNDYLANLLGLKDVKTTAFSKYMRVGKLAQDSTVEKFTTVVKEKLKLPFVLVVGDKNAPVKRVAVSTGGADVDEMIAAKKKYDVIVTGEFNYHKALDISEEGVNAIVCQHYSSELLFTWWMEEILLKNMPELDVLISNSQKEPFQLL